MSWSFYPSGCHESRDCTVQNFVRPKSYQALRWRANKEFLLLSNLWSGDTKGFACRHILLAAINSLYRCLAEQAGNSLMLPRSVTETPGIHSYSLVADNFQNSSAYKMHVIPWNKEWEACNDRGNQLVWSLLTELNNQNKYSAGLMKTIYIKTLPQIKPRLGPPIFIKRRFL